MKDAPVTLVTSAYALLRIRGVPNGKTDYPGT